ncbi:interleukin-13 receptor subunit alpha-1-like isoform X2 [Hyla sarda]|nr:interleukin-13 receptor subunit alpha-1-like isoform X2 [Hyla sarda]XP_056396053.1 interleukin-13 receptor subunit alpha-1-like isoform X2 [Hyla sarda]
MINMFKMRLTWEPIAANCTPVYKLTISSKNSTTMSTYRSSWTLHVSDSLIDLNDYFSTEIQAECNGMITEPAKKSHMQLAPGNKRTSVKKVNCVWHYKMYVNCTWQPGEDTPPNIKYKLLYWERDTNPGNLPAPTQLQDFLYTGTECKDYFPPDGLYIGCRFKYEYTINDYKELMFVVTDTTHSIKPFLYYTRANKIGKLKRPVITYVSEAINNSLYINWTVSLLCPLTKVEGLVSSDRWSKRFEVEGDCSKQVQVPNSFDPMRVKIRVRLSEYTSDSSLWSDWSEEWTVPGKGTITPLLSLILVPVVVIVLVVILLVFMKRLKMLVFPPIPQPGKMFQNDLQNWLKRERPTNDFHKPQQEDISPVTLLEA